MSRVILLLGLLAALALPGPAQTKYEFWLGATHDPSIPTFREVLGYEPGERITWHGNLLKYLDALAEATPRIRVFEYGKTWEGRRLVYAAVGSEENLKRLDEIRSGMQRLSDPRRTSEAEAKQLIGSLPAVVWLSYGVHGNEPSSSEAALLTAYHLLASRNDKLVQDALTHTLVLIDPCQNPDGRDRFIHNFEQAEGLEPDPHPLAAEHNEPWPGGRTNHYLFDMNRDWFALTQPESRGRVKALLEWYPLVFVDLHEMGHESTYYFAPEAVPYNPHLTKEQRESLDWFGKNNARWFDHYGFSYFTREIFDAFFPGYGASWPALHGAIAMTYEQATTRGLVIRRADETIVQFRDTVRQHFVASVSTVETAARERARLLDRFYRYRATAVEEGRREPVREYILPRHGDTAAVDKLAALLVEQGIEVNRATAPFRAAGREHPRGSYVVPLAQPAKRLIRTMLDREVPLEEAFVEEQERRRRRALPDQIYDVTAWSLPLLFNVEAVASPEASKGSFEPATAERIPPGSVIGGEARVAYLVPWGTAAAGRLLTGALRAGLRVHTSDKPFTLDGTEFPPGSLIFKVSQNPPVLRDTLTELAASSGARIVATDTSWVEDGVNFGSNHVLAVRPPTIALAWDLPTSSYSAGWARFVLERQFGYPVTPVRTRQLATGDLKRFHVILLPDGSGDGYSEAFGPKGIDRLKSWVAEGGILIGIGGGVSFLSAPRTGLLAISQENLAGPSEPEKKPEKKQEEKPAEARVPGKLLATEQDYLDAIRPDARLPDRAKGVIVKARLDADHWLAAAAIPSVNAMVFSPAIFTPIKLDKGVNAALLLGPDELLQSGYLWDENRKQLAYKPLAVAQQEGRGWVIGFIADPNFRAYNDAMNVLLLNAVFRGPARVRP